MVENLPNLSSNTNNNSSYTSQSNSILSRTEINFPNDFSSIETVTKSTLSGVNPSPVLKQQSKNSSSIRNDNTSFANIGNDFSSTDIFVSSLNNQTSGKTGLLLSEQNTSNISGSFKQNLFLSNTVQSSLSGTSTLSNSIESINSVIPVQLNDSNTIFSSPLSIALDSRRNKLQDAINSTIRQINPRLQTANRVLNAINNDVETGIAGILNKIPALSLTVSQSLGNLNLNNISKKIANAIPPTVSKTSSDLSNVINPLSNVITDISENLNNLTTTSNKINSGTSVNNFQISSGNQINKFNLPTNKNSNILTQNTNQISTILGNKIKSLVDSRITETSNPITDIIQNISTLGKNLSSTLDLDTTKINVLKSNDAYDLIDTRSSKNASRIIEIVNNIENVQSEFISNNKVDENLKAVFKQMKEGRDKSLKFGNELRNFNTYNYIITLGMLTSKQYNDPSTYISSGLTRILARSGGGEYSKRIQTFDEVTKLNGGHAEYFIEDVEIDSIIAPNPNTGIAMGTNISFRIVEPYSMGKFLEAIKIEANAKGFSGTSKAPFCLRIDFVGWDEYGRANEDISSKIKSRYIPIVITKINFDVNEQGSVYDISAVAYPDIALEDNINSVKTDIGSQGIYVHEILENNNESISRIINSHIENLEKNKQIVGYDRYLILFPNSKTDIYDAIKGNNVTTEELKAFEASEQLKIELGTSDDVNLDNPETEIVAKSTTPYGPPKIYKYLKIWGSRGTNINVIGKSPIVEDSNSNRLVKHPDARTIYNSETNLFQRDYSEAQVPPKGRSFEYSQGQAITNIIEDVVMNSRYIFDAPEEQNPDAKKKWFRIETMVFIEDNEAIDSQLGRPRMTYVYAVHPYFPDEAKFLGPNEAPRNNAQLKAAAPKEYDYIYTGKNEDIISFDINFNNAFYQLVLSDLNTGNQTLGTKNTTDSKKTEGIITEQKSASSNEFRSEMTLTDRIPTNSTRGTEYSPETESKRRIAELFHNRLINETVDLITCDMTIWGDPFFLPTDQGNYRSKAINSSITKDGTMEYLHNEVTCVINFLTPLDYPNKKGQFVMDFPELVKPFSGLFQIWAVTNNFSNGKFTQQLKLIRRPRQIDQPTGTSGPTKITGGRGDGQAELARRRADAQNRQFNSPSIQSNTPSRVNRPVIGPQ